FLTMYFMVEMDVYRVSNVISDLKAQKPFFSFLLRVFIRYAQTSTAVINTIYFAFYGRSLISLLDCDSFREIYHSDRKAKRIIFCGLVLNSVNFVLLYHNYIGMFFLELKSFQSVVSMVVLYILATQSYFV